MLCMTNTYRGSIIPFITKYIWINTVSNSNEPNGYLYFSEVKFWLLYCLLYNKKSISSLCLNSQINYYSTGNSHQIHIQYDRCLNYTKSLYETVGIALSNKLAHIWPRMSMLTNLKKVLWSWLLVKENKSKGYFVIIYKNTECRVTLRFWVGPFECFCVQPVKTVSICELMTNRGPLNSHSLWWLVWVEVNGIEKVLELHTGLKQLSFSRYLKNLENFEFTFELLYWSYKNKKHIILEQI